MIKMIIRKYNDNDFFDVVEIIKNSFPEISKDIVASLITVDDLKLGKSYIQLVAEEDEKVVGYALVSRSIDPILKHTNFWIDYVCVDQNYRGRGIARGLLTRIEEIAISEGVKMLQMTSSRFRTSARKLYIDLGYIIRESDIFRKVLL